MNDNIRQPGAALVLATIFVVALFVWQGSKGFSLWDEGFLWYGAQQVMQGEVPKLDFKGYDPGRYYWSAALMGLWGDDGIMALRGAVAVFQMAGLFVALLLVAGAAGRRDIPYLLLAGFVLVTWMFPRHKLFDVSLSIMLVGALAFLVRSPTARRYFLSGLVVGMVAVFGRNHGVYGVAGSIGVMLWLAVRRGDGVPPAKGLLHWAAGVGVGYLPVLLMLALIPGFASAFFEGLQHQVVRGSTNLTLPVPWPWRVDFVGLPVAEAIRQMLAGGFFLALPVFSLLSIVWIFRQGLRGLSVPPAFVAAAFLSLPYAHYAFSRADVGHLAQGIFPLLLGCLVLLAASRRPARWPLAIALVIAGVWVMHVFHPGWQCRAGSACVEVEISGSSLKVDPYTAADIELLRELAEKYAPDGRSFVAVPFWPGAYALLGRRAPMWEIYALFPRPEAFERQEIERIRAASPGFVIVLDVPLDGREELRFRNLRPLIDSYIRDNFELVPDTPGPAYQIYKAGNAVR